MDLFRKYWLMILPLVLCTITVRAQNRNPALPGTIHETFTNHSQERLSPGARMLIHAARQHFHEPFRHPEDRIG